MRIGHATIGFGQIDHLGKQHRRNIRPAFGTVSRIKGVNHTVIGTKEKSGIVGIGNVIGTRMDDVAQDRIADAQGFRAFVSALAAQKIHDVGAGRRKQIDGRSGEHGRLRGGQAGIPEGDLAAVILHRGDQSSAIPVLRIENLLHATPRTCPAWSTRIDDARRTHRKGVHVAAPEFPFITGAVNRFVAAGQVEVGDFILRDIAGGLIARSERGNGQRQFDEDKRDGKQHKRTEPLRHSPLEIRYYESTF